MSVGYLAFPLVAYDVSANGWHRLGGLNVGFRAWWSRPSSTPCESPFTAGDPPRSSSSIHWTSPTLVAAAEIAEWTGANKLSQASFKGLREDKPAREVVRERPALTGNKPEPPADHGRFRRDI